MTAVKALEQPSRHRLTVDDFELLSEAGAFMHNTRTELIEGEIFAMNALGRRHSQVHSRLFLRISNALASLDLGLEALIAPSVRMPPDSEPEPDIVLTSEPGGDGPVPLASVSIVVEVSDSTLAFDLIRKAQVYAQHGVPEYWVIDVKNGKIIGFWDAHDRAYRQKGKTALGGVLTSAMLPDLSIDMDGLI